MGVRVFGEGDEAWGDGIVIVSSESGGRRACPSAVAVVDHVWRDCVDPGDVDNSRGAAVIVRGAVGVGTCRRRRGAAGGREQGGECGVVVVSGRAHGGRVLEAAVGGGGFDDVVAACGMRGAVAKVWREFADGWEEFPAVGTRGDAIVGGTLRVGGQVASAEVVGVGVEARHLGRLAKGVTEEGSSGRARVAAEMTMMGPVGEGGCDGG